MVEQYLSKPIDTGKIDSWIMGDTLIQWIQLKLKKTDIIKKVVEEEWNNIESVK